MIHSFRKYAEHYSVLALLLAIGFAGIVFFRQSIAVEYLVIWWLSFAYVMWGIIHHIIRKDLTVFIVLEYLLIGVIAGVLLSAVVTRK